LGGAERVDTLRVEWPSGQVDEHVGVEANRAVRVVEGAGGLGTPSKQELVARR
jgi:dethiobiotin synthetase